MATLPLPSPARNQPAPALARSEKLSADLRHGTEEE